MAQGSTQPLATGAASLLDKKTKERAKRFHPSSFLARYSSFKLLDTSLAVGDKILDSTLSVQAYPEQGRGKSCFTTFVLSALSLQLPCFPASQPLFVSSPIFFAARSLLYALCTLRFHPITNNFSSS